MPKNKHPNKILVYDLEATCWEPKESQPADEQSEIIEIGFCFLEHTAGNISISKPAQLKIQPTLSTISPFCTQLTGWTNDTLRPGSMSFDQACKSLVNLGSRTCTAGAWGNYDKAMVENQCRIFNTPYPLGPSYINIKNLFAIVHGLDKELGLEAAMDVAKLQFVGHPHRGIDDAFNTARVLASLLGRLYGTAQIHHR